jgi:hypothetical protein
MGGAASLEIVQVLWTGCRTGPRGETHAPGGPGPTGAELREPASVGRCLDGP